MNVHNREKELYLYGIEREREEEERERRKRGREMPLSPVDISRSRVQGGAAQDFFSVDHKLIGSLLFSFGQYYRK